MPVLHLVAAAWLLVVLVVTVARWWFSRVEHLDAARRGRQQQQDRQHFAHVEALRIRQQMEDDQVLGERSA